MVFQNYKTSNNGKGTLKYPISSSSTTGQLNTGQGGRFPSTFPYPLTLTKKDSLDITKIIKREIVIVTNRVGDVLTWTRGAGTCLPDDDSNTQGNQAFSFDAGDEVCLDWTAEQVNDIQTELYNIKNTDLAGKLSKAEYQSGTYVYGSTSTGNDDYAVTLPISPGAYAIGQVFRFMADVQNIGPATLNINGLGAKTIKKLHDQDLETGDIEAGQIVEIAYDGTNFQMNSQIATIAQASVSRLEDSTYLAGEAISTGDSLFAETAITYALATTFNNIGDVTANTRAYLYGVSTGTFSSTFNIALKKILAPSLNLNGRLQYYNGTSWVDVDATNALVNITPASVSTTAADFVCTFVGAFTAPVRGTPIRLCFYVGTYGSETINASNYYSIGYSTNNTTTRYLSTYNGTTETNTGYFPYLSGGLFETILLSKTNATYYYKIPDFIMISIQSYSVGQSVKYNFQGITNAISGLTKDLIYYLSNTPGALSTSVGTYSFCVGKALSSTKLLLNKIDGWMPTSIATWNISGYWPSGGGTSYGTIFQADRDAIFLFDAGASYNGTGVSGGSGIQISVDGTTWLSILPATTFGISGNGAVSQTTKLFVNIVKGMYYRTYATGSYGGGSMTLSKIKYL